MIKPQSLEYVDRGGAPYLAHTEFDASPTHRNRLACIVEMVRAGGPPEHNRVLEIGCGVGNIAIPIASLGYPVTAIDIHGPSVEAVRQRNTFANLQALHMTFEKMSFAEFDTVILTEVLEHVGPCEDMLSRICNAMRPGARLVLTVPNGWSALEILCRPSYLLKKGAAGARLVKTIKRVLGTRDVTTANEQSPHVHFFTLARLARMFTGLGMTVTMFHRYFFLWLLREALFSERRMNESLAHRDFDRSQHMDARFCALWAFLLEKQAPVAG